MGAVVDGCAKGVGAGVAIGAGIGAARGGPPGALAGAAIGGALGEDWMLRKEVQTMLRREIRKLQNEQWTRSHSLKLQPYSLPILYSNKLILTSLRKL